MLVPIIALTILMGVLPNLFLRPMEPSVERMLNQVQGAPTRIQAAASHRRTSIARRTSDVGAGESPSAADAMAASFNAIVPMACVTAAGIAAMVAEAFRAPGERMPIAPLGRHRPASAPAVATVAAVEPQRVQLRRRRRRQLRPVRHLRC